MRSPKYVAHTKYIEYTHFIMTIGCAVNPNNMMTSKTEHNFQYKIFTPTFQIAKISIMPTYTMCIAH